MLIRQNFLACLSVFAASSSWAGGVGYAQATGYFKKDSRPTLYQPLNVLDGRETTAWCSPTSDPLNDSLSVGLSGAIELSELRISNGNNFDANTWATYGRARKLIIRSGKQSRTVMLDDVRGPQTVQLNPPLKGARLTIEIVDPYPAEEDPDASICLSDIIFIADGKPLNGQWLTTKLKYDKPTAALMGTWYGGFDGTPDRFLAFNFDGTFQYSYEPFDTQRNQPVVIEGTYEPSMARLTVDIAGKKYSVKWMKEPSKGTLNFDGELPAALRGPWRSAP